MKDVEESGAGGLELPFEAVKPWSAELLNSHTDLNAHRHTQEIFTQTHPQIFHIHIYTIASFAQLSSSSSSRPLSPNWSEVYCAANYFGSLIRLLHLHRLNWGDTGTWPQLVHPFTTLPFPFVQPRFHILSPQWRRPNRIRIWTLAHAAYLGQRPKTNSWNQTFYGSASVHSGTKTCWKASNEFCGKKCEQKAAAVHWSVKQFHREINIKKLYFHWWFKARNWTSDFKGYTNKNYIQNKNIPICFNLLTI